MIQEFASDSSASGPELRKSFTQWQSRLLFFQIYRHSNIYSFSQVQAASISLTEISQWGLWWLRWQSNDGRILIKGLWSSNWAIIRTVHTLVAWPTVSLGMCTLSALSSKARLNDSLLQRQQRLSVFSLLCEALRWKLRGSRREAYLSLLSFLLFHLFLSFL